MCLKKIKKLTNKVVDALDGSGDLLTGGPEKRAAAANAATSSRVTGDPNAPSRVTAQDAAEDARVAASFSTQGIIASMLTGGLGDADFSKVRKITLG